MDPNTPEGDMIAALRILPQVLADVARQHEELVSSVRAGRLPSESELTAMAEDVASHREQIEWFRNRLDRLSRDGGNRATRRIEAWPFLSVDATDFERLRLVGRSAACGC